MTSLQEKKLKFPTGQLVGGINERYIRYADTNKPAIAEAIIAQNKMLLFMTHPWTVTLNETLKDLVQTGIWWRRNLAVYVRSHRFRMASAHFSTEILVCLGEQDPDIRSDVALRCADVAEEIQCVRYVRGRVFPLYMVRGVHVPFMVRTRRVCERVYLYENR